MSIHDGHRKRLKKRYLDSGIKGLNEHELLELALTYAIPRKDVNELAHTLINRFGSIERVLNADFGQLCSVDGISEHTAILIGLCRDMGRKAKLSAAELKPLSSVGAAMDYCWALMQSSHRECTVAILLDAKSRITGTVYMSSGASDAAPLSVKEVIVAAVDARASGVVIAHNHPSGDPRPSYGDIAVTERLIAALNAVGITLLEHIIVADAYCTAILHKQTKCIEPPDNIVQLMNDA